MKPDRYQRLVLIIRDPRNPKLDYAIRAGLAERLFNAGKLFWDTTRRAYVTPNVWGTPGLAK